MTQENKKITPQERYHAKHKRRYNIDCFDTTESDIIDHLNKQPVVARYIKDLIRADIEKTL